MRSPRAKVDLARILSASAHQREYRWWLREAAHAVHADPQAADRKAKSECPVCFYAHPGRIGGAVTTTSQCGICGKDLRCCNMAIDKICLDCGKAHSLCVRCLADLSLRTRRKFDQSAVMPATDDHADANDNSAFRQES